MDPQQLLFPRSSESAPLTSPLDGRLTPYLERSQDSSPTTAAHAAPRNEASKLHVCRVAEMGCPEDLEEGANVSPASAHLEKLGCTLALSSRVPSSTLTIAIQQHMDSSCATSCSTLCMLPHVEALAPNPDTTDSLESIHTN